MAIVIALFPEFPADLFGDCCDAYEHVGQHGGADFHGVIQQTTPCSLNDAADLAAELTRIGYDCGRFGEPATSITIYVARWQRTFGRPCEPTNKSEKRP